MALTYVNVSIFTIVSRYPQGDPLVTRFFPAVGDQGGAPAVNAARWAER